MNYKLTQYSHGAGCGCKLSPGVLSEILENSGNSGMFDQLLVGNDTKDDAAVVDLDGQTAIISTTDFFMPIVDDPFDFGCIAAANAISDIYAMGGSPMMAIAILGWPIDKIPAHVAGEVLRGGRKVCADARIPLAGGHSIDTPEPIFGLAVSGKVDVRKIKRNKDGKVGDLLYLTKPLGIGVIATAQKRNLASSEDMEIAKTSMIQLNQVGEELGSLPFVHALTDVTGFGLGGHLLEVCRSANLGATIELVKVPVFPFCQKYINLGCIPGGTVRNWKTYGLDISLNRADDFKIIADPQTSGGLLISVEPQHKDQFESFMFERGCGVQAIGALVPREEHAVVIVN